MLNSSSYSGKRERCQLAKLRNRVEAGSPVRQQHLSNWKGQSVCSHHLESEKPEVSSTVQHLLRCQVSNSGSPVTSESSKKLLGARGSRRATPMGRGRHPEEMLTKLNRRAGVRSTGCAGDSSRLQTSGFPVRGGGGTCPPAGRATEGLLLQQYPHSTSISAPCNY